MNQLELRDIHLPDVGLWWPPGPGWWLLALLLLVAILCLPWIIKRIKERPINSVSLEEFNHIKQGFKQGQSDRSVLQALSRLIRRIVISYQGRKNHAGSTGEEWLQQINRITNDRGFSSQQIQVLTQDRYRRESDADIEALLQASENWIRSLPRKIVDVSD